MTGGDAGVAATFREDAGRLSALRYVHYIATADSEPECGDRKGSVTMNPVNVGCLRCLARLARDKSL
jgi:hypothetical protein